MSGECRLGCWPAPLRDDATCANYKGHGTSWTRAKAPRQGRRKRVAQAAPIARKPLPATVDLDMDTDTFKATLTQVLDEVLGLSDDTLGDRWRGGEIVLQPGNAETQEKRIPIETFFKKVTMVREKLRVLEQKLNNHPELSPEEKANLQSYITGCYGSLTTFNVLFREREDGFIGASSKS